MSSFDDVLKLFETGDEMTEEMKSWPESAIGDEGKAECQHKIIHDMKRGIDYQCGIDLGACTDCGDWYGKIEAAMWGEPPRMPVKFKQLHGRAVLPRYARPGDAGMDLTATRMEKRIENGAVIYEYGIGLAVEIPPGYEGQIRPRSSISGKDLILTNSPGTIDSGYRGEIMARFKLLDVAQIVPRIYQLGERFAQLVIAPVATVAPIWAEELSDTERGDGGYGSTDGPDYSPCPDCGWRGCHAPNCDARWTGEELG